MIRVRLRGVFRRLLGNRTDPDSTSRIAGMLINHYSFRTVSLTVSDE